ncbi:Pam16 protein (macronuclear) [Tetrahymena thermophila SB210]|uniref:Pam16 protein n=1 Tax=Tetrahymena thermophila (strain SB210) TaxID=312017 RepID=I7LXR0_TETTS|nr:Pam16 protein [Tetrahymena thermophila SB210]EAS05961.3 Pam16 protein [Tetrahymena thermophila SB210]|eukprot:XP_001026206.3 Pam16 protein [Tetrahymena thermophila SB210]
MVPNPFFQKVIIKVVTSFAKSFRSAYSSTLKKNNAAQGKKVYKFDWNDIFKHHKLNILNYLNFEKVKAFNPFENLQNKSTDATSKNNIHKMSQLEAFKILGIESETKPTLKMVMEQYLFLYSKNKPENGGSAYIQAKILNAKDMLVEQLGGNSAEMQWREINGFLDDENLVFDKKPEAKKDVKDAQDEILESTLESEDANVNQEEELKKQEEELRKQEEELNEKQDSDEESSDEETETSEKKEGEEDQNKKDNQEIQENDPSLEGEFGKYSEENPDEHENHEKEEHQNDEEVEELMKTLESQNEQPKKKK